MTNLAECYDRLARAGCHCAYEEGSSRIIVLRAPPWHDEAWRVEYPRQLEDIDIVACQLWLQQSGLDRATMGMAHNAIKIAASRRPRIAAPQR